MKKVKCCLLCIAICGSLMVSAQDSNELQKEIKSMRNEPDPVKSQGLMNKIITTHHLNADKDGETIDMMKGEVAMDYLEEGKYAAFEKYVYSMYSKFNQTSYLSQGAATLVQKNKDLDVAEHLAKKTLDLYNSYKDDPRVRPDDMPKGDWDRFMKFAFYPYCDTYAMALNARGKYKEALVYQEKAFNGSPEDAFPLSVERYAALLCRNNQEDKAYPLLLQMAKTGKSTDGMNKLLKELYTKRNKDATGFDAFFEDLQKNVVVTLKEQFKKKMQDLDASGFTLKDLDGKTVSLADFKGKTVVIDFWATWCLPCKASFPAMVKIMKRHPKVEYLYIATQEKQDGALDRVKSYITKNQYPFHVLMDEPMENNTQAFKALSIYKPQGIPAKVLIDRNGRQRFLSIGFTSDTQLINEMEAMLQLIGELG